VVPTYAEDGTVRCTACMLCVRECPDHILDLAVETREDKSKRIVRYSYEIGACMMCGLCVEACPFDAIRMDQDYELARFSKDGLVVDLLAGVDAASPRRTSAARTEAAPEEAR
ncbi:MAG TPA: 4Fe-4S dicluster domain-containing protein, partial [Coriobacteriia bacterium]|nr:4Fe-4S dicluster domain-containing protein [Coriobacteriia bacterium]